MDTSVQEKNSFIIFPKDIFVGRLFCFVGIFYDLGNSVIFYIKVEYLS